MDFHTDATNQTSMFLGNTLDLRPDLLTQQNQITAVNNITYTCAAEEMRGGGGFVEKIKTLYVKIEMVQDIGPAQYIMPQGQKIYVKGKVSEDETKHMWKADDRFGEENIRKWYAFIKPKEA